MKRKYYTLGTNVDESLRNGSFCCLAGVGRGMFSRYINGDFMGFVPAMPEGYVEIDPVQAKRLLPRVCGGKGL